MILFSFLYFLAIRCAEHLGEQRAKVRVKGGSQHCLPRPSLWQALQDAIAEGELVAGPAAVDALKHRGHQLVLIGDNFLLELGKREHVLNVERFTGSPYPSTIVNGILNTAINQPQKQFRFFFSLQTLGSLIILNGITL